MTQSVTQLHSVSEVYGERYDLTLWEAARLVLEAGGEISRGDFGEPRLALPELVQREPMLERDAGGPPVSAAEALCSAHPLDGRSQPFCQLELTRRGQSGDHVAALIARLIVSPTAATNAPIANPGRAPRFGFLVRA